MDLTDSPAVVRLKAFNPNSDISDGSSLRKDRMSTTFISSTENGSLSEPNILKNSLEELMQLLNEQVTKRIENIEDSLDLASDTCDALEEKVEQLCAVLNDRSGVYTTESSGTEDSCSQTLPIGPGITVITLNTTEDYPDGSWLGDETRPELRVRCPMTPTELFHINTTCTTAEKMALTLLDYLFDRETQACSNISGTGKHKKKKLDPLFIYGIQCHLIAHFGITGEDWTRIKQNIDSKCRTAFRRKVKGLPLFPKGGQPSHSTEDLDSLINHSEDGVKKNYDSTNSITLSSEDDNSRIQIKSVESLPGDNFFAQVLQQAELIKTEHGDIQVLRATTEELAEIQQTHQIQLLSGGHLLAMPLNTNGDETSHKSNT